MSMWSAKRQLTYSSIFFLFVFGILFVILRPIYNRPATCFDNRKNGNEVGIDCGGSCILMCKSETVPPLLLWANSYKVTDNIWNAVSYIENQNPNSYGFNSSYEFRIYDKNNLLIAKTEGETFVNPNGRQPIISPGIDTGGRIPKKTIFSFTKEPTWYKNYLANINLVSVNDLKVSDEDKKPYITANITNISNQKIPEFELFAFVYDSNENVVEVSKTTIDKMDKSETKLASFTWNNPFPEDILRYEIIPVIDVALLKK